MFLVGIEDHKLYLGTVQYYMNLVTYLQFYNLLKSINTNFIKLIKKTVYYLKFKKKENKHCSRGNVVVSYFLFCSEKNNVIHGSSIKAGTRYSPT